jgi:SHS2 domain-containing protein
MYEHFDHTADLGLRARAATLPELFADAGKGLAAMLVEEPGAVREAEAVEVRLPPDRIDFLFFDWLKALLALLEERRLVLTGFEVQVDEANGLTAACRGEPLDPSRHEPAHEVKAVTYHGLRVEKGPDGWLAEAIVDI